MTVTMEIRYQGEMHRLQKEIMAKYLSLIHI